MEYYFSLKDSYGYVHSVDNLVLTYYVENIGTKCIDKLISDIQKLKEKYNDVDYWEKLNLNPSRKYSFYQHAIHLDMGIYILLGHYTDFDKETKQATIFPMIKLEINPNKHGYKPIFKDLLTLINSCCYDCTLNRYDYAIDIPLTTDKVQVFGTNKEKGLYKGTRYYGQRNKNGFCRIYDKQKEQGLDTPLTRVEHVISTTKTTKSLSFEKIYIQDDSEELEKLSKTDSVIVELCQTLKANNLDFEDILNKLDRRKKKTIISHLHGNGYKQLGIEKTIHDLLIDKVIQEFGIKDKETIKDLITDDNGFIDLENSDLEVPFD